LYLQDVTFLRFRFMTPRRITFASTLARFGRSLLRPWFLCCLLTLGAAGLGSWAISGQLAALQSQPEYRFAWSELQLNPPHEWVPLDFVNQAVDQAGCPPTVSLLEPDLAGRIGRMFEQHPWVQSVSGVQVSGIRGVIVRLQYRIPVAWVDQGEAMVAVDYMGALLPAEDFTLADRARLPVIRGIRSAPPELPGQVWDDPVLKYALEVASALNPQHDVRQYWQRYTLAAIIAPEVEEGATVLPHRLTFELETRGGSCIVWGHPASGDDLEPSPVQKLGRLDQYLRQYGSFEQPRGPYRIDIRNFDAISLQQLPARRTAMKP
jgi:hypothetical protein